MHQIIYMSSANHDHDNLAVIDEILQKSRINNAKNNITGILLYHSGIYIQLLEGRKDDVESLFEKISNDSRHGNVNKITTIEDGERIFPRWEMAYKKIDHEDDLKFINEILRWNNHISRLPKITNQQIIKMLSHFREMIDGKIITDYQD